MSFVVWFCGDCPCDNVLQKELVGCRLSGFPSRPQFHLLKTRQKTPHLRQVED